MNPKHSSESLILCSTEEESYTRLDNLISFFGYTPFKTLNVLICKIHSFYNKVPFPRQRVQTTHSSLHRSVRIRSDLVTGWLIKSEREATLSVLIFTKRPGWRLSAVALQTMGVCLYWGGGVRSGGIWMEAGRKRGGLEGESCRTHPTPQSMIHLLYSWRTPPPDALCSLQ